MKSEPWPLHTLGFGEIRWVRSPHHSPLWAAGHIHYWQIKTNPSTPHLLQSRDWHSHRLGPSHCSKGPSFPSVASLPRGGDSEQPGKAGQLAGNDCSAPCPLQLPVQKSHSSDGHEHTASSRLLLNTEIHCRCTVSQSSSSLLLPGYTTHLPQHLSCTACIDQVTVQSDKTNQLKKHPSQMELF